MKYRIERSPGVVVIGELIQTKGNDTDFPTFILSDGTKLSVDKSRILGVLEEFPPPDPEDRRLGTGSLLRPHAHDEFCGCMKGVE